RKARRHRAGADRHRARRVRRHRAPRLREVGQGDPRRQHKTGLTRMNGTTSLQDAVRINSELVRLLYRQTPTVLGTICVVGAFAAWGLWGLVEADALVLWTTVLFGYTGLRALVLRIVWRRAGGRDEAMLRCARIYAATSAVSGLMWGWLALAFIPSGAADAIVLISLVLAGMIAGARTSLSSYLPARSRRSSPPSRCAAIASTSRRRSCAPYMSSRCCC